MSGGDEQRAQTQDSWIFKHIHLLYLPICSAVATGLLPLYLNTTHQALWDMILSNEPASSSAHTPQLWSDTRVIGFDG